MTLALPAWKRPTYRWAAKLAATVLLLWTLQAFLDLDRIRAALAAVEWHWGLLGAAIGLIFASLRVMKWQVLARANGLVAPHAKVMRLVFQSLILGILTPGRIGEAMCLAPYPAERRIQGLVLFAFDRATEVAVVLLLAIPACILFAGPWAWLLVPVAVAPALVLFGPGRKLGWLKRLADRTGLDRFKIVQALTGFPVALPISYVVLNVISQLVSYFGVVAFIASLAEITTWLFFPTLPVVTLSNAISVTIGGLGVREGLAALLLPLGGIAPEVAATSFLLSFFFTRVTPGLLGMAWSLMLDLTTQVRRQDRDTA